MPKALSKFYRQYVHVNNGPAQRLARKTDGVKVAPMPAYIEPLLATDGAPPRGNGWAHEIKYDGYRFQLHMRNGQAKFFTRRGHDWSDRVNSLVLATGAINSYGCIIDGEVVVPLGNGGTDFGALESELKQSSSNRIAFYAFDLLYLDGLDLRRAATIATILRLSLVPCACRAGTEGTPSCNHGPSLRRIDCGGPRRWRGADRRTASQVLSLQRGPRRRREPWC
jgi:hypothetical protein